MAILLKISLDAIMAPIEEKAIPRISKLLLQEAVLKTKKALSKKATSENLIFLNTYRAAKRK